MANTLTSLIPDAYAALDVVSRELTGMIVAVQRNSTADQVEDGQTLRSIVAPANTAGGDISPAMALPTAADQTIGNKSLTITKNRFFPFSWNGGQEHAVNKGPGYLTIRQDQIAQAIRACVNEIELDLTTAAAVAASRAFGATAGTAPLFTDWAQAAKILDDNGAPMSDRQSVMNTAAAVALRSTSNLYKVNEGGNDTLLRQGLLGDLYGFNLRQSAQIVSTTKGTGTSYTSDTAGYAIGATSIAVITGTGTIVAGDIITFTGDTNKYIVTTGVTAAGTIVIAQPGLRVALATSAVALTIFGTSARNLAFSRNAIVLATRLPKIPLEGDMATDRQVITDPRTGLSFELSCYPGFRMNTFHLSAAWGQTVFKPEHLAVIIG